MRSDGRYRDSSLLAWARATRQSNGRGAGQASDRRAAGLARPLAVSPLRGEGAQRHRGELFQGRSRSLMLVLERVCASTVLTMMAAYML